MVEATGNCYDALGVPRTATSDELKAAYAAILKNERARIAAGAGNPESLAQARAAYATLSDPVRRAGHDAALPAAPQVSGEKSLKFEAPADAEPPLRRRNVLARAWRGEVKAWKIFWFLVVPSWLLLGLVPVGLVVIATVLAPALLPPEAMSTLSLVLLLVLAAGPVLLWRCAFNVSWRPLGYAARAGMVVLVLSNGAVTGELYRRLSDGPPAAAIREPIAKERELLVASQRGDLKKVKALIAAGADVKLADPGPREKGRTALHWAAGGTEYNRNGKHLDVARLLLAHGADVNAKADGGYTPLHVAAGLNQVDIVRWLLDNGADVDAKDRRATPLEAAVLQGHEAVVAVLLERKPRLGGVLQVYQLMGTYYPQHTAILRRLLDAGADVNEVDERGATPIAYVARRSEDAVVLLLTRGADLSAGRGDTAGTIGAIVGAGYLRAVEHMFTADLDPGIRGRNGETLMHYGVDAGEKMLALLHSKGARYDLPDNKGDQPIHYAARQGRSDAVRWLVTIGADPGAKNRDGKTAMQLAETAQAAAVRQPPRPVNVQRETHGFPP